jgi:hypothetical protein
MEREKEMTAIKEADNSTRLPVFLLVTTTFIHPNQTTYTTYYAFAYRQITLEEFQKLW